MITAKPKLSLSVSLITLLFAFLFSILLLKSFNLSRLELAILPCFAIVWVFIGRLRNLYFTRHMSDWTWKISHHLVAYGIFLILLFTFYLLFPGIEITKEKTLAILVGFPVIGISVNYLLGKVSAPASSQDKVKYTLITGVGSAAKNVEEQFYANHNSGRQIKGFVFCKRNEVCAVDKDKIVASLKDLNAYLMSNQVDEIVIASPGKLTSNEIQQIISAADYHGIRIKYILDYHEIFGANYKISRYGRIDAVNIRQLPLDGPVYSFLKNCFDKVFGALALILLSPVFLALAILIKLDSPGSVFYCPIRIGKGGKPFKLYKFRSMAENDSSAGGTLSTKKDDPRITKLGKILRKYSLDEFPQFINVLMGDMSVVGPRPHRRFLNQQLQENDGKYMVRHYVKPGITGWAQVNGWRGPTDTAEQKTQRTAHDLWYTENWSLWLDFKIIYLTIFSKKVHNSAF